MTIAEDKDGERIEAVLQILRKQMSLTVKQEKFCTDACVARFLKCRGNSVKKAAKQLNACLRWRDSIGVDHMTADEFAEELAEGVAYVAGHDDAARPVVVFRIKHDYAKARFQRYIRLLVFTLEVAVLSMPKFVEQFVLIFDASFFRSAPAFFNLFAGSIKLISDNYPARLHRAFVLDPPSLFPYLWKGSRPFMELWSTTFIVRTSDIQHSEEAEENNPGTSSLLYPSSSSRFSFTVVRSDSLSPWYLSRHDPSSSSDISPLNSRSFSFSASSSSSKTPRPPFLLLRQRAKPLSSKAAFLPFLRFHRRPYDELSYRSMMKPPLCGLLSVVHPAALAHRRRLRP
ncbi:phosphatidylinositol/phosphatidylcholine transfer protein SFH3-like [Wolffia australiana]